MTANATTQITPATLSPAELRAYSLRFSVAIADTCQGAIDQAITLVIERIEEGSEPEGFETEDSFALAVVGAMVDIMRNQAYDTVTHPYEVDLPYGRNPEGHPAYERAWRLRYVATNLSSAAQLWGRVIRERIESEGISAMFETRNRR